MRVAICLSGLVRTYRETYSNFRQCLIDCNPECMFDIFISSWGYENSNVSMERTRRLAWYGSEHPEFPEELVDFNDLFAKYRPTAITIEEMRTLDTSWYHDIPSINLPAFMSMTYKLYHADMLRRTHERLSGFQYDVVIRARFDSLFPDLFVIPQIERGTVIVPSMTQPSFTPGYEWTNDKLAVGTSADLTLYSKWYNCIPEMLEEGVPLQPEVLLRAHLDKHKIQVQETGYELELIRPAGF